MDSKKREKSKPYTEQEVIDIVAHLRMMNIDKTMSITRVLQTPDIQAAIQDLFRQGASESQIHEHLQKALPISSRGAEVPEHPISKIGRTVRKAIADQQLLAKGVVPSSRPEADSASTPAKSNSGTKAAVSPTSSNLLKVRPPKASSGQQLAPQAEQDSAEAKVDLNINSEFSSDSTCDGVDKAPSAKDAIPARRTVAGQSGLRNPASGQQSSDVEDVVDVEDAGDAVTAERGPVDDAPNASEANVDEARLGARLVASVDRVASTSASAGDSINAVDSGGEDGNLSDEDIVDSGSGGQVKAANVVGIDTAANRTDVGAAPSSAFSAGSSAGAGDDADGLTRDPVDDRAYDADFNGSDHEAATHPAEAQSRAVAVDGGFETRTVTPDRASATVEDQVGIDLHAGLALVDTDQFGANAEVRQD